VSRRARAIAFGVAALACAGLAASVAGGYRGEVAQQLGELRPVVVAAAELPARRPLRPADAAESLEVRRVPARFLPPGAVDTRQAVIGLAPLAPIPAGSYLVVSQFRPPGRDGGHARGSTLPPGREPVQIAVTGAEPLAAAGGPAGARVDVIVTTEPAPGRGPGRTYVAAEAVRLLALEQGGSGRSETAGLVGPAAWTATLALTRPQALRLIQAESFARQLRLIPASGR
jgi:Flp pilus assembly protein CpaB